jgi:hypothetical protein
VVRTLIGSVLLLITSLANANIVTIEPDDFALGTNLSNATQGVHLSTLDGGDIYAAGIQIQVQNAQAPTGNLVFAHGMGMGLSNWYAYPTQGFVGNIWGPGIVAYRDYVMIVRFDRATDYVSFSEGGYTVGPFMAAYDENGDLLDRSSLVFNSFDGHVGPPNDGGAAEHYFSYEVTSAQKNIGFVMIGGNDNSARIDNLRYASVPEPATGLLFLGALVVLIVSWRVRLRHDSVV